MRIAGAVLVLVAGCAQAPPAPVELRVETGPVATRLELVPSPGWRINALLPPAFEEPDGSTVRFSADSVSADSSYYLTPPTATLPGVRKPLRGTLRASVCAAGEQVCRPYVKAIEL